MNLLGVSLEDRPAFFAQILTAILELRTRTGRPHWLVVDEAHHLLPRERSDAELALPQGMKGVLMITVHPEHLSPDTVASVDVVVAIGKTPHQTLGGLRGGAADPGAGRPDGRPPDGRAPRLAPVERRAPRAIPGVAPRDERRRHRRKYAEGELPPDRSFYFRGPKGALNLRAQNLKIFLQVADGVDEATWSHHLAERRRRPLAPRGDQGPDARERGRGAGRAEDAGRRGPAPGARADRGAVHRRGIAVRVGPSGGDRPSSARHGVEPRF